MRISDAVLAMGVFVLAAAAQTPGDPLAGLGSEQLQLFQAGRSAFRSPYPGTQMKTSDGGQRASLNTCNGCHVLETNYSLPPSGSGSRMPPAVFGAGLVEGIADETILGLQNRPEALALGIRGRAAMVVDGTTGRVRVGRFGWKGQHATIADATAEGLSKHLGVLESVYRNESPDPVTGLRTMDLLAAYPRLLAPVRSSMPSAAGDALFGSIGCSACHTRSFTTLPPESLNRVTIEPFSDFLLHDIGTGDGVAAGAALGNEMRTAPLWGLRLRQYFLHDGSARTLGDAIRSHQGEATMVRQRFEALTAAEQQSVIEFLKTL